MKSINYALIFVFSAVLTVACGGGGGGGASTGAGAGGGVQTATSASITNNLVALSAAFAPVAF
jgi:hypothetical protein